MPLNANEEMQMRWVSCRPEKMERALAAGYEIITTRLGTPVTRGTGTPDAAILMQVSKIKRNLGSWLNLFGKNRSPAVLDRIMRLNKTIKEGARVRGWNPAPTLKALRTTRDITGKREFIRIHGRGMWGQVPKDAKWKSGKREYIGLNYKFEMNTSDKNSMAMQTLRSERKP
jgi:hypothetical protein